MFRNCGDPAVEVDRFVAYNQARGWTDTKGCSFDTPAKRSGLAGLWECKTEGQWARPDYLEVLKNIAAQAQQENIVGVEVLLNHRIKIVWSNKQSKWLWHVTADAKQWIEANAEMVRGHLEEFKQNYHVAFELIK